MGEGQALLRQRTRMVDCTPPPGVIQSTRRPASVSWLWAGPDARGAGGETTKATVSENPSPESSTRCGPERRTHTEHDADRSASEHPAASDRPWTHLRQSLCTSPGQLRG